MNKPVNDKFIPISEYLLKIERDTENGWYEIEIGVPNNWKIKENKDVDCEIVKEFDFAKLIKMKPKHENVFIDDLLEFARIVIDTNKKILEKEEKFIEEMKNKKAELEEMFAEFYKTLEEEQEKAFDGVITEMDDSENEYIEDDDDIIEKPIKKTTVESEKQLKTNNGNKKT